MAELAAFQDAFTAALRGGSLPARYGDPRRLAPGLRVYRNTVFKGVIDALAANYPTVVQLVGDEWFQASAHAYLERDWPTEPALAAFGGGFPDFLAGFSPATELAYLADVACLDRCWTEAHVAADAPVLESGALARLEPQQLAELRLTLIPSARACWFETPAPSIWRAHRSEDSAIDLSGVEWRAEGMLIARPAGRVEALLLDAAAFTLLIACARGATLGEAAAAAFRVAPDTDLPARIAEFLAFGAFGGGDL